MIQLRQQVAPPTSALARRALLALVAIAGAGALAGGVSARLWMTPQICGPTPCDPPAEHARAVAAPSSATAPATPDGVYAELPSLFRTPIAMSGTQGHPRIETMEIRGDAVWWNPHLPNPATGRVVVDAAAGEVSFHWNDGSSVSATYAVVDGFLWLGVFRRDPNGKDVWRSVLEKAPPRYRGSWPRTDAVMWNERTDEAVVIPNDYGTALTFLREYCEPSVDQATNLNLPCNLNPSRADVPWPRTEDAIIAPWSVNLGPAGMLPSASSVDVVGSWATAAAEPEGHRLRVVTQDQPLDVPFTYVVSQTIEPSGVPNSDHYRPNQRGIVFSPYGWNCGQNHLDEPGYLLWFPLDGDRLWAHHHAATHHGSRPPANYLLRRQPPSQTARNP